MWPNSVREKPLKRVRPVAFHDNTRRFKTHRCGSFLERLRRAENSSPRQA